MRVCSIFILIIRLLALSAVIDARPNIHYAAANNGVVKFNKSPSTILFATPTITVTPVIGNISACRGSSSTTPNTEQFSVSGSNLTNSIKILASPGFEVSFNNDNWYTTSITIIPHNGDLYSTNIYVRSSPAARTGFITGKVTLTSQGASTRFVTITATIKPTATISEVTNKTFFNGAITQQINFVGTANSYSWVNDMPAIGLAASGEGNILSFTAINNTSTTIVATITVTPLNSNGCDGKPITFTITVQPAAQPPTLTTAGALLPLTTIYGTTSPTESFTISGTNISSGISVSAPTGFEVSSDGIIFSASITFNGEGIFLQVPVYIRLAPIDNVGGYSGNIIVSSDNVSSINVQMPVSSVTPAALTIAADYKTKPYLAINPPLTVTYQGFVNNDAPAQLITEPSVTTTATTQSVVGQYPIVADGAASLNYDFVYITGVLTIESSFSQLSVPNTFTPNADGINDIWNIKYLDNYPRSTVNIFDRYGKKLYSSVGYAVPWDGTYNGKAIPSGTYYYIIDPKTGQQAVTGWVVIVR